ncbi:MAG: DUF3800 domain-containing protein [Candidatus Zixiibacteriota bacterium]
MEYNVYCDESCHLENDGQPIMVLGAVWCPAEKSREISVRIREIKLKHNLPSSFEIKWTKVSSGKERFYLDLLDYFFDDDDLHFRAIIADGKNKLDHPRFAQDHDTWYYKMYFSMLKAILGQNDIFYIYLDIKDTRGSAKVAKLHDVLSNSLYDFDRRIVQRLQIIRSNEVEMLQLADLLIGAVAYANRKLTESKSKIAVVNRMRERSGFSLVQKTLLRENKVNLFKWTPSNPDDE